MKGNHIAGMTLLLLLGVSAAFTGAQKEADKATLVKKLWSRNRIEDAIRAVDKQRADGLLSEIAYQKKLAMLNARLSGTYDSQSLSVADPPLNFIQNGGFEMVNRNSARNRSRWLWWSGWSWGGDYENMWEDRPEFVHSGEFSARITCTGTVGRIGINTPPLPAVPGATGYTLTFWARGQGDNVLFINFEDGAGGTIREKIPDAWRQYSLVGKPEEGKKTYQVYFYSIGAGTIWLDDVELTPIGGRLEE